MGITARHSPFSICYYFGTNPTWFQFGIPREVEEHTPTLKFSVAFICIRSLLMGRGTPSFSLLKTNVGSSAASDTHTWLTSVAILVFKREGSTDRKWQPWQYTHGMLLLHAVTEILGIFTRQTILTPVGGSPAVGACTTSGRGCWFCVLRSFCFVFFLIPGFVHTWLFSSVVWKLDYLSEEVLTLCVSHFDRLQLTDVHAVTWEHLPAVCPSAPADTRARNHGVRHFRAVSLCFVLFFNEKILYLKCKINF